jgi:hypothetical protein
MHRKIAARLHQLGCSTQIMTILSCMYLRFDRSANLRLRKRIMWKEPGKLYLLQIKTITCHIYLLYAV